MSDVISTSGVSTQTVSKPRQNTQFLMDVPEEQRARIASGMRWTVWLSAISLPFSYTTAILLARVSPEAIGTYGLLNVYIGVVLGLFYLGGDAVAIKFVPELDAKLRSSFLATYYAVVCLATVPWIVAAAVWPRGLHYLFGDQSSRRFQLFLIAIAPLCALTSLVGAALKGRLEITWAQILIRLITIGSFAMYVTLYFLDRSFLAANFTPIIWGTYLGLSAAAAAIGIGRLFGRGGANIEWHAPRWLLPRGFWKYTLSLQQLSALGFFTQRLDALLVLNFGSLAILGKYVALITLAESIRLISKFFLDALLPGLTNMVAARNMAAAADVFTTHMRILFLVTAAATCGLVLLARPLTELLGARYEGLAPLIIVLAFFVGFSTPAGMAGILLSAIGKQQRAVWVVICQLGVYVAAFTLLWRKWELLGAVMAYGISWVVGNFALLIVAKISSPFRFRVGHDYIVFGIVSALAALAGWRFRFGVGGGLVAWAMCVTAFLAADRYSFREFRNLVRFFLPFQLSDAPTEQQN